METTFTPTDTQKIFQMLATLIANYRDGQAGLAFFNQVGALSAEWEHQGLPCVVPKHGRLNRTPELMQQRRMARAAQSEQPTPQ
jgi:hypothetical protein